VSSTSLSVSYVIIFIRPVLITLLLKYAPPYEIKNLAMAHISTKYPGFKKIFIIILKLRI